MLERSWPMCFGPFSRPITTALLAAVLAGTASHAQALGLGDITLHSSLGQPLNADIALVDAKGLDDADLSVALATAEEFARAGVDRAFFLNDLRFQPVLRGDRTFIHVSSTKAVTEPYLDFLVQLNRPSGQLLREFTVLLDPPGTVNLPPAPKLDDIPVSSIASAASVPARASAPKVAVPLPPATQGKRLDVQRGDTFWSIAKRLQAAGTPTPGNTLVRDLRALNPGQLKAGQTLLLPDVAIVPGAAPAVPAAPVAAPVPTPAPAPAQAVPAPVPTAADSTAQPAPVAPVADPGAQPQVLQEDIDELNAKLQALQAQVSAKDQQVQQLQNQLAQARAARAPAPALPVVDDSGDVPWLPILGVVLILLLLAGMVYNRRRQKTVLLAPAVVFDKPDPDVLIKPAQEDVVPAWELTEDELSPAPRRESGPATDALDGASIYIAYGRFNEATAILREGLQKEPHRTDLRLRLLEVLGQQGDVAGFAEEEKALLAQDFSAEKIDAIREHYPKLQPAPQPVAAPSLAAVAAVAPAIAEAPVEPATTAPLEDFQLNLDDLSMDADWDLVSPFDPAPARKPGDALPDAAEPVTQEFASNLKEFPDVYELPDEQFLSDFAEEPQAEEDKPADGLDDAFLDNFVAGADLPELDALTVDFDALDTPQESAQKLEQAQHCIDQGDMRSAADLLHEVLREGDDAYKQVARQLLSKIA
ncbi:FimV/HubP family polar landmark protein [Pseudomonas sp. RIT-To-2]|uniref:FimV/HubP family polar landmark protein n=1 Tax=Pseudomonas sp. RIT-To-2 TaxID=3462541 RepID=UPI002413C0F1